MNKLREILVCPNCNKKLIKENNFLCCNQCKKKYPVIGSIIDFRGRLTNQERFNLKYFKNHSIMIDDDYRVEEWHKSFLLRFKNTFKIIKNKIILDGGIGQGYMTIELAKEGATIIACDIVFEALVRLEKIAQSKGIQNKIVYLCCSLESLPIKNNIIDYFISNAVLEHLDNDENAIAEINRVNKRKSGAMVTVPLNYRYNFPIFIPFLIWQDWKIGHKRRYDGESIINKFKKYKFIPKEIYYSGHFIKVIAHKILFPIIRKFTLSAELVRKVEEIDRQQEKTNKRANNLCVLFER